MSSSKRRHPNSNILFEKAYLTNREWMEVYTSVTESDREEYFKKASSLTYDKTIGKEARWF